MHIKFYVRRLPQVSQSPFSKIPRLQVQRDAHDFSCESNTRAHNDRRPYNLLVLVADGRVKSVVVYLGAACV